MEITLNLIDNTINEIYTETSEFKDFAKTLYELEQYSESFSDDFYLEEVKHKNTGVINKVSNTWNRTKETTKDLANLHSDITDVGGSLISATWKMVMGGINLISKALTFILNKIIVVPNVIAKAINTVEKIPNDIKNKISGNLALHITANDIADLYNRSLMLRLDNFFRLSDALSEGEVWTTFIGRKTVEVGNISLTVGTSTHKEKFNDIELCKRMQKEYDVYAHLTFEKTWVNMKDKNSVDIYFGNSTAIKFTDLKGQKHSTTYLGALQQLANDIKEYKKPLEQIQQDIGKKFSESQANGNFAKLTHSKQNIITKTIQMMSKTISVVGNIIKYIMEDISTVNKELEKVNLYMSKKSNK